MADDEHLQARLQRIEDHLRNLDQRVSVLSSVEDNTAREKIARVFDGDPRMVIIYRGIQRGMTQQQIAAALEERGLEAAQQQRVSESLTYLQKEAFIRRIRKGGFQVREGWEEFDLERTLRLTLRRSKIDDLS